MRNDEDDDESPLAGCNRWPEMTHPQIVVVSKGPPSRSLAEILRDPPKLELGPPPATPASPAAMERARELLRPLVSCDFGYGEQSVIQHDLTADRLAAALDSFARASVEAALRPWRDALRTLADASETAASSDPDMPSHEGSARDFDDALDAARALLDTTKEQTCPTK